jgi:hypothetical protein
MRCQFSLKESRRGRQPCSKGIERSLKGDKDTLTSVFSYLLQYYLWLFPDLEIYHEGSDSYTTITACHKNILHNSGKRSANPSLKTFYSLPQFLSSVSHLSIPKPQPEVGCKESSLPLNQCGRSSLSLRVSDIFRMWLSHWALHSNTWLCP